MGRQIRAVCGYENWSISLSVCVWAPLISELSYAFCLDPFSLIFSSSFFPGHNLYQFKLLTPLPLCYSVCVVSSLTLRLMVANDFWEIQCFLTVSGQ